MRKKIITPLVAALISLNTLVNASAKPYYEKTAHEIYKEAEQASRNSPELCLNILSNIGYARDGYNIKDSLLYCDIMHLKALCFERANRYDEALALLESIYQIDYSSPHNARGDCSRHYHIPRLKRDILYITGKYQEAIAIQNIILDSVRNLKDLYSYELLGKAKILMTNQQYDEALSIYDNLIENFQQYSLDAKKYKWPKAECYSEMKEYNKAIETLNEIINTDPEAKLYCDKAEILIKQNEYKKALKVYEEGIRFDPKFQYFYVHKARFLAFNYKNYKDAINIANKFHSTSKNAPNAKPILHGIKGYSLMMLGKNEQAIYEFNILHQLNPMCSYEEEEDCIECYKSYIWKATCLTKLGKYDEALKSIDRVTNISSVKKEAMQEREWILKQKQSIWSKIKSYFVDH